MNISEIKERLFTLKIEHEKYKVQAEGGKLSANGVYGKLGSSYSPLYSPNLLIATTLTGQLSILMLAEQAESAGVQVVSANTDGVVFRCPRNKEQDLDKIITWWEAETGFEIERARYRSLYSSSVNCYLAVREDGKIKRKGPIADPWKDNDLRGQMMKNPQMTICSEAVLQLALAGTPIEETINACTDPRAFVTTIKVAGGGLWRGRKLGRAVRYYWSTDGDPITYADAARKVAKTDGAAPLLELIPGQLPPDLDRARYRAEAARLAIDLAVIAPASLLSAAQ